MIGDVYFEWEYFEKFYFEKIGWDSYFKSFISKKNHGYFEFNFENEDFEYFSVTYGCLHYVCWELKAVENLSW